MKIIDGIMERNCDSSPFDGDPDKIVKNPLERYDALQASVVIIASRQIASGVPLETALDNAHENLGSIRHGRRRVKEIIKLGEELYNSI